MKVTAVNGHININVAVALHNGTTAASCSIVVEIAAVDGKGIIARHIYNTAIGGFVVVKFTVVDGNSASTAVGVGNRTIIRNSIIMETATVDGKGRVISQPKQTVSANFIVVDIGIIHRKGISATAYKKRIACVIGIGNICNLYIAITTAGINAGVRYLGKGYIDCRNIRVAAGGTYTAVHVGQSQGLALQFQRVTDGRRFTLAHLDAVGRAGEDAAGAACFIFVGLFIGQGKGVGVLTVGQGDLTGEGVAVQVQGDRVIHGGSRDLLAHIGQQVDAGGAVFLRRLIQRGLQGGVLFAGPGAEQAVQTGHKAGRALQGVVMLGVAIVGNVGFQRRRGVIHQPGIILAFQLFSGGQGHFARVLFHKHIADTLVAIGESLFAHSEAGPRTNVRDAAFFGCVVFDFAILGGQAGGQHSAVCIFHIQSTAINA